MVLLAWSSSNYGGVCWICYNNECDIVTSRLVVAIHCQLNTLYIKGWLFLFLNILQVCVSTTIWLSHVL